ncbi:unnamed protein product [Soboliphyme baturini]|uniref:Uncharacterized protein n=1 Tax=Soboliphyme baturini TaxID=241478 RepID=A0A183IRL7_9BILA|nr:unnamed protein product [Soboliphyme baturini]
MKVYDGLGERSSIAVVNHFMALANFAISVEDRGRRRTSIDPPATPTNRRASATVKRWLGVERCRGRKRVNYEFKVIQNWFVVSWNSLACKMAQTMNEKLHKDRNAPYVVVCGVSVRDATMATTVIDFTPKGNEGWEDGGWSSSIAGSVTGGGGHVLFFKRCAIAASPADDRKRRLNLNPTFDLLSCDLQRIPGDTPLFMRLPERFVISSANGVRFCKVTLDSAAVDKRPPVRALYHFLYYRNPEQLPAPARRGLQSPFARTTAATQLAGGRPFSIGSTSKTGRCQKSGWTKVKKNKNRRRRVVISLLEARQRNGGEKNSRGSTAVVVMKHAINGRRSVKLV